MSEPTAMNRLLAAIADDEVRDVKRLLRADAGLATRLTTLRRDPGSIPDPLRVKL